MPSLLDYAPIAATCFAVPQFLPQIRKLAATRDATGLSWSWAALTSVNNAAWFCYFTLARYPTALIPSSSATLLAGTLAVMLTRQGQARPRPAVLISTWAAMLVAAYSLAGRTGLGSLLTVAFVLQVMPSISTAYRTPRPTGVSAGTWLLIFGEVTCWLTFGLHKSDPRLIGLGVAGVTASALMLTRIYRTSTRRQAATPDVARAAHQQLLVPEPRPSGRHAARAVRSTGCNDKVAREPAARWWCKSSKAPRKERPMSRSMIAATALAAGMSAVLLGCSGGPVKTATGSAPAAGSAEGVPTGAAAGSASHRARPVTMAGARRCPVTIGHPVPRTAWWRDQLAGWNSADGNGSLWVGGLWPRGVVIVTKGDVGPGGKLGMKFGWYRLASGYLTITGRRLDAPAPPASGLTFRGSYGLTGFNASGVIFPTEGCWRITGRVGRVALTFVTFVIKGHCDVGAAQSRCVAGRVH